MKKFLAIILCIAMLASVMLFAACDNQNEKEETKSEKESKEVEDKKVEESKDEKVEEEKPVASEDSDSEEKVEAAFETEDEPQEADDSEDENTPLFTIPDNSEIIPEVGTILAEPEKLFDLDDFDELYVAGEESYYGLYDFDDFAYSYKRESDGTQYLLYDPVKSDDDEDFEDDYGDFYVIYTDGDYRISTYYSANGGEEAYIESDFMGGTSDYGRIKALDSFKALMDGSSITEANSRYLYIKNEDRTDLATGDAYSYVVIDQFDENWGAICIDKDTGILVEARDYDNQVIYLVTAIETTVEFPETR